MCGISLQYITSKETKVNFEKIKYRGPDETKYVTISGKILMFHRLSINDLNVTGSQPFVNGTKGLICNGEIYNYYDLKQIHGNSLQGNSDCEIIFAMFLKEMNFVDICKSLDGDFAFIFVDNENIVVARDPIGVRPLYYGENINGDYEFCSEIKGIPHCKNIKHFPPGYIYTTTYGFVSYKPLSLTYEPKLDYDTSIIYNKLTESVKKRLLSDRDIGFFLSGGLDSSIIAAIGAKLFHPKKITTFSIGIKGHRSPDLIAAKKVADHLNSNHFVYEFTFEEAFACIKDTIYHLETYDCTTIRASVPMFLLSKYVSENHNHKVILSGEGADELFGGYLYFHNAPDEQCFHNETIRLLKNVHQFDVLRADRCTAGNGLELRVPFFDKDFIEYVTNIKPMFKMYSKNWMEKTILRRSFENMLPPEIVWRQKNGMSDAVGYAWVDQLKEEINLKINKEEIERKFTFSHNEPLTSEEMWYRKLYIEMFGDHDVTENIWRPRWTNETDPSARKLQYFVDLNE